MWCGVCGVDLISVAFQMDLCIFHPNLLGVQTKATILLSPVTVPSKEDCKFFGKGRAEEKRVQKRMPHLCWATFQEQRSATDGPVRAHPLQPVASVRRGTGMGEGRGEGGERGDASWGNVGYRAAASERANRNQPSPCPPPPLGVVGMWAGKCVRKWLVLNK